MPESLYALAVLACPLGMGLMIWMMMRAGRTQPANDEASPAKEAELARLKAEIDLLRRDDHSPGSVREPSS